MSFFHYDENGHTRDKYDNYKDSSEVEKAIADGVLKSYDCGKYAYNPNTGEDFYADGTKRN